MANICESQLTRLFRGATISGLVEGANLDANNFFILFYVDRRKALKIAKSDMVKADVNKYSWVITSELSAKMDLGTHIWEMCIENNDTDIGKKKQAFFMEDSLSKDEK